jgi:hypothetical protein
MDNKDELLKDEIIKGLEPLFERAEKKGLWFENSSNDVILSPKELREHHAQGTFIWGASSWELVDPKKHLKDLEHVAKCAQKDVERFKARMKA